MSKKEENDLLDQKQILNCYGLTKAVIRKYFPKPQVKTVHGRHGAHWTIGVWPREQVEQMLTHPEVAKAAFFSQSAAFFPLQIPERNGIICVL